MENRNNKDRELFFLLLNEFENHLKRVGVQKTYVIKSDLIALKRAEFIENIVYISGKLATYFNSGVNLLFTSYGVVIDLKPLKEKKYISRSHVADRWGKFGRDLVKVFAPEPDKLDFRKGKYTPTQLYLTSRIKEIEETEIFKTYSALLTEHKQMKSKMDNI